MDWTNWCRLCGNYESLSKIDPEIIEIVKTLNLEVNYAILIFKTKTLSKDKFNFVDNS